jgi:hypothetical protein
VTFLPSGHYWMLQWSEAAIFVVGAVLLTALGLRWVRRHMA